MWASWLLKPWELCVLSLANIQPSQVLRQLVSLNKESMLFLWKSVSFAPYFFQLFKTLPCIFEGFYQVTRKQIFLCLQQSQHTHTDLLPKTRGKLPCFVCQPFTPDIILFGGWFFSFPRTFHPIKSYFLLTVLMMKCSCTLFGGKFHSISCHLLHCKRFSPYED